MLFCRTRNPSGRGSTAVFYRDRVQAGCDDDLGATLGLGYIQLESLFLRMFGIRTSRNPLPVNVTDDICRSKISLQYMVNTTHRTGNDVGLLGKPPAIVQCLELSDM